MNRPAASVTDAPLTDAPLADAPLPPRWFADNPDKAWAERFFLLYSPVWMVIIGVVMLAGWTPALGDVGLMALSFAVLAPMVLVPIWRAPGRYALRANLYLAIFSFLASYFGTEYFFDVLGMVYGFDVSWNLDSALVGRGEQRVPFAMYILAHVYFVTYHTSAVVVLRRLRQVRGVLRKLWPLAVFAVAYTWAWLETASMANPWIAEQFSYRDLDRMLTWGSVMYAMYFVVSFPIFYWIDEERPWTVLQTVAAALSASMLTIFALDVWAAVIGPL